MSQVGSVTLTGYVTAEPKLRHTKDQTPVAHVRVGCTTRRVDHDTGEWRDGNTSFFTVNCWRKLAIAVRVSLHKGDPIIVKGRLRTRSWSEDGRTRTEVEIDADALGHDLTLGWAVFQRNQRGPANLADTLAAGEMARAALGEIPGSGDNGSGEDPGAVPAGEAPDDPLAPHDALRDETIGDDGADYLDDEAITDFTREIGEGVEVPA
jgi:single-strand DNA-binding protein